MRTISGTDYTKRKKDVLVITVGSEEEPLELRILPPTKRIHEGMLDVARAVDAAAKGEACDIDLGDAINLVAETMSNNTDGRAVTPEFLESHGFDMADTGDFLGLYLYFITELVKGKN